MLQSCGINVSGRKEHVTQVNCQQALISLYCLQITSAAYDAITAKHNIHHIKTVK